VPGDSGGGLFMWNPARKRIELIALCSTGDRVGKNVADFDGLVPELARLVGLPPDVDVKSFPPDAIIYRTDSERIALEEKFRRQTGGWILDSEFRAGFEHVQAAHRLIDLAAARYDTLLQEREKILTAVNRLEDALTRGAPSAEVGARQAEDIGLLRERALLQVQDEIERLKPTRY